MPKTLYLFRHSTPLSCDLPNEKIPLSEEGKKRIFELVKSGFETVKYVYSSPCLRALQTAAYLKKPVIEDERLTERKIGDPKTFTKEIWEGQYTDINLKNTDGESFFEVSKRMTNAINDVLSKIEEGEEAAIVSHAAAICAYLMNWCKIEVINADNKERMISFNGKPILVGEIETPSYFKLTFEQMLIGLSYYTLNKQEEGIIV